MNIKLTVEAPGRNKETLVVRKPIVTIGRGPTNDICLSDPRISRFHACITSAVGGRLIARDLGSQNGTFSNSKRIYRAAIARDDVLQIGNARLSGVIQVTGRPPSQMSYVSRYEYDRESGVYHLSTQHGAPSLIPHALKTSEQYQLFFELVGNLIGEDLLTASHTDILAQLLDFAQRLIHAESGVIMLREGDKFCPRLAISPSKKAIPTSFEEPALSADPGVVERDIKVQEEIRYGLRLRLPRKEKLRSVEAEQMLDLAVDLCAVILEHLRHHGINNDQIGNIQETCLWDLDFVTNNPGMLETLAAVKSVAETGNNMLFIGETGSGKDLLAQFAHKCSPRRERALIPVNCAALPESLVESLLFGVGKRIATGVELYPGYFEQAHKGTLFLDEVAELPVSQQPRFLRVLESKTIYRLGAPEKPVPADVIVYFAGSRDLSKEISAGNFREDLYYRISDFQFRIPPLRDRADDIPLLANFFLDRLNPEILGFTKPAIDKLMVYHWPGNVRQLYSTIKRACVFCNGQFILPEHILLEQVSSADDRTAHPLSLAEVEKAHILRVMDMVEGRKSRAAEMLGISRPTLNARLREYGYEGSDSE